LHGLLQGNIATDVGGDEGAFDQYRIHVPPLISSLPHEHRRRAG
jgi:hypothetical protein